MNPKRFIQTRCRAAGVFSVFVWFYSTVLSPLLIFNLPVRSWMPVAHNWNPSYLEAETGRTTVQGQLGRKFIILHVSPELGAALCTCHPSDSGLK